MISYIKYSFMRKILKIIKIFTKSQFTFQKPKKKEIVIFDKKSELFISNLFEKNEYIILDTSFQIINIFIILKLIFSLKKLNYINYYSEIIKLINPKFIFTFIDNNLGFYKIKKNFKNIKFISIQNGTRFVTGDILELLEKDGNKYNVDHYFTFNQSYAKEIEKFIKGDYKIIGSFKNNLFDISKNYEKGTLCYISRMSDVFLEYSININREDIKKKYKSWEIDLVKFVRVLLENIDFYCAQNNLKLNIIGSSLDPELEKNFYNQILKKSSYNFFPKKNLYDSYKIIDKFEVCINPMSTFGYEALAREKKVCFFSSDFIEGSNFCWPLNLPIKGNFYTNSNSKEEVKRILEYLFSIDEKEWINEISNYKSKLFFYDKDNKIIKSFLTANKITRKWG